VGVQDPVDVLARNPQPMMMKFSKGASRDVHATQCLSLWMGLVMIFDACGVLRLDELKSLEIEKWSFSKPTNDEDEHNTPTKPHLDNDIQFDISGFENRGCDHPIHRSLLEQGTGACHFSAQLPQDSPHTCLHKPLSLLQFCRLISENWGKNALTLSNGELTGFTSISWMAISFRI
jgi:hypothetical protein